jgi:hypothetical protein
MSIVRSSMVEERPMASAWRTSSRIMGLVYHGCRVAPVRGAAWVAAPSYEVGTSINASAAEASNSPQRHHPVWAVAATYR